MDYLKAAKISCLTEEHDRYANTCALIAIAEELRKLNERLANASPAFEADLAEMGYVPPV